jgi:hypothetical protein
MADVTVLTIQQIGPLFKHENTRIFSGLAGTGGITAGQGVYCDPTTGTFLPTTTGTSGKYQFRGIALETVGAGQAFDRIEEGAVGGFDLSALNFDALVYVSDTAGKLATAAGTNTAVAGRVMAMSDRDPATSLPSKVLYVRSNQNSNW